MRVKLYNINEYSISMLINNLDSLAPRGADYPRAKEARRLLFGMHLDSDR